MTGCKIIRVKNLLGELLATPGGISRGEAVQEATKLIEELREDCEKAVPVEITRLETLVAAAGKEITARQLTEILAQVDPLLTLSGTFGSKTLDIIVKRFCDLCAGMLEKGIASTAPLNVHLGAMHLVWKSELNETECEEVLAELARIHGHYGIESHALDEPDFDEIVKG
jgi:hypothetical protein